MGSAHQDQEELVELVELVVLGLGLGLGQVVLVVLVAHFCLIVQLPDLLRALRL